MEYQKGEISNMKIKEEWLREIFDKYDKKISDEYKEIKANSYGVDIRDSFSICLRDKFNENEGKRTAFVQLKNEILEKQKN